MKATTVALPNTYHHPVSGGTGCFASAIEERDQSGAILEGVDELFEQFRHQRIIRAGRRW